MCRGIYTTKSWLYLELFGYCGKIWEVLVGNMAKNGNKLGLCCGGMTWNDFNIAEYIPLLMCVYPAGAVVQLKKNKQKIPPEPPTAPGWAAGGPGGGSADLGPPG